MTILFLNSRFNIKVILTDDFDSKGGLRTAHLVLHMTLIHSASNSNTISQS